MLFTTYLLTGNQNDVPVILGWNANEGFGGAPVDAEQFRKQSMERYGNKAEEFLKAYLATAEEEAKASQEALGGHQIFWGASL